MAPKYSSVVDSGGIRYDGDRMTCKGCDAEVISASARYLFDVLQDGAVMVVAGCPHCGCEFHRYAKREQWASYVITTTA